MKSFFFCFCFSLAVSLPGAEWFASPSASLTGNGSRTNPWPLHVALTKNTVIQPGDILNLRGGHYRGPGFVSTLTGTSNSYITVRSHPREWAVVTDGLQGTLATGLPAASSNALQVSIAGLETLPIWPVFMIGSEMLYTVGRPGTNWNLVRGWGGSQITPHAVGERVTIATDIILQNGSYVTFRDFEITSLDSSNRVVGTSNYLGCGLNLLPPGRANKAVNLIVHNVGHPGIGFWQQGGGGEINGCLLWGIGMYDRDGTWTRGSAIYAQNATSGMATVRNCINFRNFTSGGKVYGETGPVLNFGFYSNIVFQCDPTIEGSSGSTATSNLWYEGNVLLGSPMLSYVSLSNRATYFINNQIVNGTFTLTEHTDSVLTNNVVFMRPGAGALSAPIFFRDTRRNRSALNMNWNRNRYHVASNSSPSQFTFRAANVTNAINSFGGGILDFVDGTNSWSAWSGFDSNTLFTRSWPMETKISMHPSEYDSNRWHVAVVNPAGATNAVLDLAAHGFVNGQGYQLVDAQNWPVVVASGTYTGTPLNLPLNLTNVSVIPGMTHLKNEHTNIKDPGLFNAFVLMRTANFQAPAGVRIDER